MYIPSSSQHCTIYYTIYTIYYTIYAISILLSTKLQYVSYIIYKHYTYKHYVYTITRTIYTIYHTHMCIGKLAEFRDKAWEGNKIPLWIKHKFARNLLNTLAKVLYISVYIVCFVCIYYFVLSLYFVCTVYFVMYVRTGIS